MIAPSEYDDPWGENRKSYPESVRDDFYDGDDDEELNELDDPHTISAYTRPIYYGDGDIWGEADPYEGPDGLRRENEGVRLERLGAAPNGRLIYVYTLNIISCRPCVLFFCAIYRTL